MLLSSVVQERIYHKRNTFNTDPAHVAITGFRSRDLEDGKPYSWVKQELVDHFQDSLIISQAGHNDFKAFGMSPGDYTNFDLQSKFLQQTGVDKHGYPVMQPISLRRLCLHFFKEDIQGGVHSAEKDAIFTMRLFHVYQDLAKKRGLTKLSDMFSRDEFENVPKLPKKH